MFRTTTIIPQISTPSMIFKTLPTPNVREKDPHPRKQVDIPPVERGIIKKTDIPFKFRFPDTALPTPQAYLSWSSLL